MSMDAKTFDHLQQRARNGSVDAMRQLARLSCWPNSYGYGRAQAYKYSLVGAFLGDQGSKARAAAHVLHLSLAIEAAVTDEVGDWICEKCDAIESESDEIVDWSPELLQWMRSITGVH